MADKYLVQHRRGTAQEWADKSYEIPREGEIVIEIDYVNSLHKLKIGDGIHAYAELNYLQAGDDIVTQILTKALPRVVTVILDVNKWAKNESSSACYSQTVVLDKISKYSRLDLQPDTDMLAEFKNLGVSFVTENQGGTLWVHSVGAKPATTYIMQATIIETEVEVELDKIVGTTIGVSNPYKQPDWNQTDSAQLDFIYNKPNLGALALKDQVTKADLADDVLSALENTGSAVTIVEILESSVDGGSNVVTFSDGKNLTIKNGSKGSTPVLGVDYFTEADKAEMVDRVIAALPSAEDVSV